MTKLFDQPVNFFARRAILQSRERGRRSQVIPFVQRSLAGGQFEHRITAQRIGDVTIGVTAGGLANALTKQVGQRVIDVRRVARIVKRAEIEGWIKQLRTAGLIEFFGPPEQGVPRQESAIQEAEITFT
jgi:hypothetical protein